MLASLLNTLQKRRDSRVENEDGFTLIELLVVVVIIGILIAIAIPLYSNYKKGAENKSAQSDVRNAIPAIEQYYADNNTYPTAVINYTAGAASVPVGGATDTGHKIAVGTGNKLGVYFPATSAASSQYVICAWSTDGGTVYKYDSTTGQYSSSTPTALPTGTAPSATAC